MDYVTGLTKCDEQTFEEVLSGSWDEKSVVVSGMVHMIRDFKEITFLILRRGRVTLQVVVTNKDFKAYEGMVFKVKGQVNINPKAPGGREIEAEVVEKIGNSYGALPLPVGKVKLDASLNALLDYRAVSLRNIKERAKFKLQEGIVRAFRDCLTEEGFTEIHTPKINSKGAEGGSNIFKLDYFGKKAVLAQSPQFYKQMMVGVFDRVFEVGPVFRAEKHSTVRHLNEYTSLDLEMGYIDSFYDIMNMETKFLQRMCSLLEKEYSKELELLGVTLPKVDQIPTVRFSEAKELVSKKYDRPIRNPYDLEPEEEHLIGQYFKEEYGADFVFVTAYPSKKRPFYAMDEEEDKSYTKSFDLLFRGIEVTTGGQRIHDYEELLRKIEARGMTTEGMDHYLLAFKAGMPPHGGLGIGLERMTMKLLECENVKEASLFPRDMTRLEP